MSTNLPIRTILMDLRGLRGVVFGVVNKDSIAWDIVEYLRSCGAEIILVGRREKTVGRLKTSTVEFGIEHIYFCDVMKPEEVDACFAQLSKHAPFDFFLHSIAASDPAELRGRSIDSSAENYASTMLVSAFSFRMLARRLESMMPNGGGMVALSFEGAEHPFPHYNIMCDAKAALEAAVRGVALDLGEKNIWANTVRTSPKETLSSKGIGNSKLIGLWGRGMSMREGRATRAQFAQAIGFLLAVDAGITGETVNADNGASTIGMFHPRHARIVEQAGRDVATAFEGGVVKYPTGFFDEDE